MNQASLFTNQYTMSLQLDVPSRRIYHLTGSNLCTTNSRDASSFAGTLTSTTRPSATCTLTCSPACAPGGAVTDSVCTHTNAVRAISQRRGMILVSWTGYDSYHPWASSREWNKCDDTHEDNAAFLKLLPMETARIGLLSRRAVSMCTK